MNKIIKYITLGLSSILIGCSLNYAKLDHNQIIKKVSTLKQAKDYCLNYLKKEGDFYNHSQIDYWSSFKKTHERGNGDCEDGALAIIALLGDDGYGAKVLIMQDFGRPYGHTVYLHEKNGKFGSGGINEEDWKLPIYNTIDKLVKSLNYNMYHVLDLNDSLDSIINSDNNLEGLFLLKYINAEHKFVDD